MPSIPKITDKEFLEIYARYDNGKGESLRSLAKEYNISQPALSKRIKKYIPPKVITKQSSPPKEDIDPEQLVLIKQYAHLIWRYAKTEGVNELRTKDVGRFQQEINTVLSTYLSEIKDLLVEENILIRGTRGGYIV